MTVRAKAAIKRATLKSHASAKALDAEALAQLLEIYRRARRELEAKILRYASPSTQTLRIESMRQLLDELDNTLDELARAQRTALFERMAEVAALGIAPVAEMLGAERLSGLVDDSVLAARSFVAADGLQLADRLWRVESGAKEVVGAAVQNAIVQGMSASEAAADFISRGQDVPAAIRSKMTVASADRVARVAGQSLMRTPDSAYQKARRVFRTEINRAHGMAYQASLKNVEGAVGTKFLLGAGHPKPDICDMHAQVNLHGLGPGVYPHGKSPWPAHPNTLSFEVVVFDVEVTDQDRQGKQTRIEWLKSRPARLQGAVLGSRMKRQALLQGHLKENQIATPWKVLERRYARQGIEVRRPAPPPTPVRRSPTPVVSTRPASADNPFAGRGLAAAETRKEALRNLREFAADVKLRGPGATLAALNSIASGFNLVLGRFGVKLNRVEFLDGRRFPSANGLYKVREKVIGFRSSYYKDQFDQSGKLRYNAQKKLKVEQLRQRLKDPRFSSYKAKTQEALDALLVSERWSISSVANDRILATSAHEAGHAIQFQGGVVDEFGNRLARHKVQRLDWYRVSEYAGTNEQELFAEVTAAFALGLEDYVPNNIGRAYLETLDNMKIDLAEVLSRVAI